jgi:hypothetical protein
MAKNITLAVPDDLVSKMDKFKEVNWSAVARDAIDSYIKRRSDPNIAPTVDRLVREKDTIYDRGRKKAQNYVSGLKYTQIEKLFNHLGSDAPDLKSNMANWDLYFHGVPECCIVEDSPIFYKGFRDALVELKEKLAE